MKKMFLKISQNSQENTCAGVSFFNKFLRTPFLIEHLRATASEHFFNFEEFLKYFQEVIVPYVKDKRLKLGLTEKQTELLIMDVCQTTADVINCYKKNNIQKQPSRGKTTLLKSHFGMSVLL